MKDELIPSFRIDHTQLLPGIYISRQDTIFENSQFENSKITTYDIRMKRPNVEPVVEPAAMHTIEHIIATYLRNDPEWKDKVVYWGPMGCLTGSYLIVKGAPDPEKDLLPLIVRAFKYLASFEGEVPGTKPENCGNYRLHDLIGAKREAEEFLHRLEVSPCFNYPIMI